MYFSAFIFKNIKNGNNSEEICNNYDMKYTETTTETETPTPGFGMSLYYSGEISTYDMHRAAKRKEQAQEQTGAPDTVPPETEA